MQILYAHHSHLRLRRQPRQALLCQQKQSKTFVTSELHSLQLVRRCCDYNIQYINKVCVYISFSKLSILIIGSVIVSFLTLKDNYCWDHGRQLHKCAKKNSNKINKMLVFHPLLYVCNHTEKKKKLSPVMNIPRLSLMNASLCVCFNCGLV